MLHRKKLGMIGGMGSLAAAYTFDRIIKLTPAATDQEHIEIFVHNNNHIPDRTRGILYGGPDPLPELKRSVSLLNSMYVDYIILACMTSHYYIETMQQHSRAEVINALAETAEYTHRRYPKLRTVGLLATTGSIKLNIFQKEFEKRNIRTVVFDDDEQKTYFMDPVYAPWGIKAGFTSGKPQELMREAAAQLVAKGAEAVVAGCTEVPLVLSQKDMPVPFLDTIDILAEAAIEKCIGESPDDQK
jgi:aspartate racemase